MKYIDLFAGVGGFRYGISMRNREQSETRSNQAQDMSNPNNSNGNGWRTNTLTCVYSNEWDKYANSVYRKHYGECDDRDIRTVPTSDIPDHDLLVGGFPCQAFSVAGKRGGFDDTRGTLFFEIARILRDKRPRYFLLENVKGLLSHDSGKTFQTILRVLSVIGYEHQWQVLNSKDFGVPQNRERVYIVGHLRGESRPQVFPLGSTNPKDIIQLNQPTHSNNRIYSGDGLAPTLNTMQGGRRQPKIAKPAQWRRTEKGKQFRREAQKTGKDLTPFGSEYRELVPKDSDIIGTITAQAIAKDSLLFDPTIRRLTPIECERLQGFPDNYTKYGHDGKEISDTQRYKMMGNAVTTNVITTIINKLQENL